MKQPTLFLMLGYPGAGKTSTAQVIHELTGAVHLWADHTRRKLYANPTYSHQENLELYRQLNHEAEQLLASGKSVIFDTNFNFYKDREHLRGIAKKHGALTVILWVTTPKNIARERATHDAHIQDTRVLGNIPIEAFERMSRNLEIPRDNEKHIRIDGTKVSAPIVKQQLLELL